MFRTKRTFLLGLYCLIAWNISIAAEHDDTSTKPSPKPLSSSEVEHTAIGGSACQLSVRNSDKRHTVEMLNNGQVLLTSPPEGLWSIATDWQSDWPTAWHHAHAQQVERVGPWLVLTGQIDTEEGTWEIRDAYRSEGRAVKCVRRFQWHGKAEVEKITLSVRWQTPQSGAQVLLPGICYYGNPSGVRAKFGTVAKFSGQQGEEALFEEHRYPIPYASLEWSSKGQFFGAALHSLPSPTPYGNVPDQWWSLGAIGRAEATELTLLSGPCAINGQHGQVKALQRKLAAYPNTYLCVAPGAVIEKTFWLEVYPVARQGSGFRHPLRTALDIHQPFSCEGLPTIGEIVRAKYRFAKSRWHKGPHSVGFMMYPSRHDYVMGWAGQSEAPGYALQVLAKLLHDPKAVAMARESLDFLATSPLNKDGFLLRYNPDTNRWSGQDPISQGQAMDSFARAIRYARRHGGRTDRWESFLRKACDLHAARILADGWHSKSTNEAFLVSPLCIAHALFGVDAYRRAALKAAEHFGSRHLDMTEPYWGGTLDARCEDKEGAWAAFQAFMAAYRMTGDKKYLRWAEHACDVVLTYVVFWDIDLPAGRLSDHQFRTRGWTDVSVQNQHLDVYGVLIAPEVYRLGQLTHRDELQRLALLMYRSCGQLIDPQGSQGEQIQQTNYAQRGEITDVYALRGGYAEGWTVFWITAHFLNAAAQFQEMGVPILVEKERTTVAK